MAKVKLQWRPPKSIEKLSLKDKEKVHYQSWWDVLQKVYENEGFAGWYSGLGAQILKAVLSQAILFVSKEKLTAYTNLLFMVKEAKKE